MLRMETRVYIRETMCSCYKTKTLATTSTGKTPRWYPLHPLAPPRLEQCSGTRHHVLRDIAATGSYLICQQALVNNWLPPSSLYKARVNKPPAHCQCKHITGEHWPSATACQHKRSPFLAWCNWTHLNMTFIAQHTWLWARDDGWRLLQRCRYGSCYCVSVGHSSRSVRLQQRQKFAHALNLVTVHG